MIGFPSTREIIWALPRQRPRTELFNYPRKTILAVSHELMRKSYVSLDGQTSRVLSVDDRDLCDGANTPGLASLVRDDLSATVRAHADRGTRSGHAQMSLRMIFLPSTWLVLSAGYSQNGTCSTV